jgi:hypothetical protein
MQPRYNKSAGRLSTTDRIYLMLSFQRLDK